MVDLLGRRSPTPLTIGGTVRDWMTATVLSCRQDERLYAAAKVLWDVDCGAVPVTNADGVVVGVLTDRDICMAAYTQARPLSEISIASVLSGEPQVCGPDDSLDDVVSLMRTHEVRRIPVVDTERKLLGMLSLADLALYVASLPGDIVHAREVLARLLAVLSRRRGSSAELR